MQSKKECDKVKHNPGKRTTQIHSSHSNSTQHQFNSQRRRGAKRMKSHTSSLRGGSLSDDRPSAQMGVRMKRVSPVYSEGHSASSDLH